MISLLTEKLNRPILMRIAIQAKALSYQNMGGIGYYTYHLIQELLHLDQKNSYHLASNAPFLHPLNDKATTYVEDPGFAFSYLGFPKFAKTTNCDLIFIPKEVLPFNLPKKPCILTAYDFYYLKCGKEIKKQVPKASYLHYLLAAKFYCKRADAILAISEYTKKDLIEIAKVPEEKIFVTPLGYDQERFKIYSTEELSQIRIKYNLKKPYLINTSSLWWKRKNLIRVLQAFHSQLAKWPDLELVITGTPGLLYPEMIKTIEELKISDKVHLLQYVPRVDLPLLLGASVALIFPSLDEGYGIPLIEAMACGCPIITSNISALPEVAKDAALLVDPLKTEEIADAVDQILGRPGLKETLIVKGKKRAADFTWQRTAKLTLEVINSFS